MTNLIRKTIKEKGQGLTEYVLILAFIAGVAFMMFGGNGSLKETVAGTFTETVRILAGLFDEEPDWGHMDPSKDFNDSNSQKRLEADQQALKNIASMFLGKSKNEVRGMLNGGEDTNGVSADGKVQILGWFVQNDQDGSFFVNRTAQLSNPNNELKGTLNAEGINNIYSWMQGDKDGTLGYDPTNKYLVSDYAVQNGWTHDSYREGNGVKIILQYEAGKIDGERKVVAAKIAIDPNSRNVKPNFNYTSSGLEVAVNNKGQVKVLEGEKAGLTNNFNVFD